MQRTPGVMHVANRADVGGLPTVVRVSPHSSECATSQQLSFSRSYLSSYHGVIPRNPRHLRFLPSGMQNCFELLMERYVSFLRRSQPPFIRRCQTSLPENSRGFIAGEEKCERESHELLPPSVGPAKLGQSSRPLISRIRGFPFERTSIESDRRRSSAATISFLAHFPIHEGRPIFFAVALKSMVEGNLSPAMGSRPTKARAGNSGSRNYRHFFPRPRNLPLKCRFRITSRHGSL